MDGRPGRYVTLGDFNFRDNGIGFLRLFFAAAVVWSHAYGIGRFGGDPIFVVTRGNLTAGLLAVAGFFVLSGFLITRSFESLQNTGRFLWHRWLRIYPGYFVCLVIVAFGFAALAFFHERGTLAGFFFGFASPWSYVASNALLMISQGDVRGVALQMTPPPVLNGSLWTLQWESLCYIGVAALGIAGAFRRNGIVVALIAAVSFLLVGMISSRQPHPGTSPGLDVLSLLAYFAIGSYAYIARAQIPMRREIALVCAFAIAALLPSQAYAFVVLPCFAYLVLYAGMMLPIRSFDRRVDLSYGLYIYAYPIQQLLALFGMASFGFAPYFFAGLAIALGFAALSWFTIERPSLSLKNVTLAAISAPG
jgi:peptidoglycan/LPS O-acetylase OafA/YrhL